MSNSGAEDGGGESVDGGAHDVRPTKVVTHSLTHSLTDSLLPFFPLFLPLSHSLPLLLPPLSHFPPSLPSQPDTHFMKKLPPGSEASNVLVGEVEFLDRQIIAFVRLKEGVLLGDITEVNIRPR